MTERRRGRKQDKKGNLRRGTINKEEGAYVLHLDKSKGERKREIDRNRREKEEVIEELCDDKIFIPKQGKFHSETKQIKKSGRVMGKQ